MYLDVYLKLALDTKTVGSYHVQLVSKTNALPCFSVSHMEHAELNFYKGSAKQMNIIMDLWGLGLMRMPPMEILSRIGTIMNRDYAGKPKDLSCAD